MTRTEEEARTKAENLRQRLDAGEDFATIARAESDASSSGPRGGLIGTYARDKWPPAHAAIETASSVSVGQTTDVIHAPYVYAIVDGGVQALLDRVSLARLGAAFERRVTTTAPEGSSSAARARRTRRAGSSAPTPAAVSARTTRTAPRLACA